MKSDGQKTRISGTVAPGFDEVRDAFEHNFSIGAELGAACAAYYQGHLVVDLWGGIRDMETEDPWKEDTIALVSSTTKGLTSMTVALAHSRGLIELDEPVAVYWPEFAQGGKDSITVRQLMAHQAGLCALDVPPTFEDVSDPEKLAAILAGQRPAWDPGTRQGYHAMTFGWYVGELIRRVDPQHRSVGRFFQEEIAEPLGVDFHIGLPAEIPDSRIATIKEFGLWDVLKGMYSMPPLTSLGFFSPKSLIKRTFATPVPQAEAPAKMRREYVMVEGPAYNGVGSARGIAKAYSSFAIGAKELSLRPDTREALICRAPLPASGGVDRITGLEMPFSLGFCKPFPGYEFGSNERAFGMPGLGGSFGYADPDTGSSFAYVPNRWYFRLHDDPRQVALWKAFGRCVARKRQPEPNQL